MIGTNGKNKVLIVDPDSAQCARLGRVLAQHDYEVYVSHDGASALGIAVNGSFAHAVIELDLPNHSGLKLVERLKTDHGGLRIVVLASHPSIAMAVEAIKRGAIQYLPKPVLPEQVIAAFEGDDGGAETAIDGRPLSLEAIIWEHIDKALITHGGNVSAAARALDMHRRTLQRKLRQRTRQVTHTPRISKNAHDEARCAVAVS